MLNTYNYYGIGVVVEDDEGRLTRINIRETARTKKPLPLKLKPDMSELTDFETNVIKAVMAIPAGKTSTYANIAKAAGRPGAARAVGNVMAKNPMPIIVPCHRVIRADLTLGGFAYGPQMKRRLLEKEGVVFNGPKVKMEFDEYFGVSS